MVIYIVAVAAVVVLSSTLLVRILKKKNMFNSAILIAVVISSITASFLFPFILNVFSAQSGVLISFLVSLLIYITLVFLLSLLISFIGPDFQPKWLINAIPILKKRHRLSEMTSYSRPYQKSHENQNEDNEPNEDNSILKEENMSSDSAINLHFEGNVLEKPVDTEQNTDKMGLEEIGVLEKIESNAALPGADDSLIKEKTRRLDLSMELSVDECIEEAFRLKEGRDIEGAILYYLYALDKNLDKDLAFWIILDICALYKTLGQPTLARKMLENSDENYGDIMDKSIKDEIERNLSYS